MKQSIVNALLSYNSVAGKNAYGIERPKPPNFHKNFKLLSIKRSDLLDLDLDMFFDVEKLVSQRKRGRPYKKVGRITDFEDETSEIFMLKPNKNITYNSKQSTNKEVKGKQILERDKIRRKASAKKSLVKNKLFNAIKLIDELKKESIPSNIKSAIFSGKFSVNELTTLEQRSCFDFFSRLKKEELVIILLMFPNTQAQLDFVREELLKRKSIDSIFRDLLLENII